MCQAGMCLCAPGKDASGGSCIDHPKNTTEVIFLCVGVPLVAVLVILYTTFKLMRRQRKVKPHIRMSQWMIPTPFPREVDRQSLGKRESKNEILHLPQQLV